MGFELDAAPGVLRIDDGAKREAARAIVDSMSREALESVKPTLPSEILGLVEALQARRRKGAGR